MAIGGKHKERYYSYDKLDDFVFLQAEMVAVKRMKKKEISISRKILIEVKQVSI